MSYAKPADTHSAKTYWKGFAHNSLRVMIFSSFLGVKVMFRVALVLFKYTIGRPEVLAECTGLYETMEKLKHLPPEILKEEFISREVR